MMAWRRPGDKPLSEPMLAEVTDEYMRHSASMSVEMVSQLMHIAFLEWSMYISIIEQMITYLSCSTSAHYLCNYKRTISIRYIRRVFTKTSSIFHLFAVVDKNGLSKWSSTHQLSMWLYTDCTWEITQGLESQYKVGALSTYRILLWR